MKTVTSWNEENFQEIESTYSGGMTVQQIVDVFLSRGQKLTEATFRKYVQLGLLPRSVRVARKGKRRGSQGLYPATSVRQIDEIRRLMSQGYTIEEIQREFLFIRGDVEEMSRQLERIFAAIERVVAGRRELTVDSTVPRQLEEARTLKELLVGRLDGIEKRLSLRARMARAVV